MPPNRSESLNKPHIPPSEDRVQIILNTLYLSVIKGQNQLIEALLSEIESMRLTSDERKALTAYRCIRDLPPSATYNVKTLETDLLSVELDGRPNLRQFSGLTYFCFKVHNDAEIVFLKYTDESGKLYNIENPTPDHLNAFKNSIKTEFINGTYMLKVRDIEIIIKPVNPTYDTEYAQTKEEFLNTAAEALSTALKD